MNSLLTALASPYLHAAGLAFAAALTLAWILRRAPIGQAAPAEDDDDAPTPRARDRAVAAAVAGMILVGVGATLAATHGVAWSILPFALGYATIVAVIRANRPHRHASPTLRRVVAASETALTASLLVGVLVIGNVLAFKYGGRSIDFTRDRSFSLAPLTINQLKALDRPASFTLVFGQSDLAARQLGRIRELLDLFRAENPGRIKVATINPFSAADRTKVADLAKRIPALTVTEGGMVVVEVGEGESATRTLVRNKDLFAGSTTEANDPNRRELTFTGENALIAALAQLRAGKAGGRVAFLGGHGEPSIHDDAPNRPGLGLLRERLESFGARVVVRNLVSDPLPPDIEVVIVAGPTKPFQRGELERLQAYVEGGGRALVLLGWSDPKESAALEDWLKGYDVEVGPGLVLDPKYNYGGDPSSILGLDLGGPRHPIVEALANQAVVLPRATPVAPAAKPANEKVAVATLLRSSPTSTIGEAPSDPKSPRTRGPASVGVAVSDRTRPGPGEPKGGPKLVVLGSRYAADNVLAPYNTDLLLNAINWLRGRDDQRGAIPPRRHVSMALAADPSLRAKIVAVPTLMAFAILAVLGTAAYLSRRD